MADNDVLKISKIAAGKGLYKAGPGSLVYNFETVMNQSFAPQTAVIREGFVAVVGQNAEVDVFSLGRAVAVAEAGRGAGLVVIWNGGCFGAGLFSTEQGLNGGDSRRQGHCGQTACLAQKGPPGRAALFLVIVFFVVSTLSVLRKRLFRIYFVLFI